MNKKAKPKTIIPRKIEIVGLMTSVAFQRAKLCAQTLCKYQSKIFSKAKYKGMLEFDWDEHLMKQRRKFGGPYWSLLRPVAVYIDGQLIGSDLEFIEMVNYRYSCRMKADNNRYKNAISCDYSNYLLKSKRCYVYMEIWIEKTRIGNLIFQLYSDLLPETCYNFRCLCTGEKGHTEEGIPLTYKNTDIFRICPMGWIQGGDIENISGGGGRSVYGATFADESYCISHERRGVLSMANDGKHSNGSQFFVTLQPTLWMDYYYVAFGQLVEGVEVLKAIEKVSTLYEKPTQHIKIGSCGVLYAPESAAEKEERERLAAEEEAQRLYDIDMRRIAMLNECTVISSVIDKDSIDQTIKFVPPADVLDPRDVPSELSVQRFLDGEYYVMDIPINTEDIIRPILKDLADGVINEEDLISYTSNELLARSIIMDCIAKGIVGYDDYDIHEMASSDIDMIHRYLWGIIANMSTTSTKLRRAEDEEFIKGYLEKIISDLIHSSPGSEQKIVEDQHEADNVVQRDEDEKIIEEDGGVEIERATETEDTNVNEKSINMEGEGLEASEGLVDGMEEINGAEKVDEAPEDGDFVVPIGSNLVQNKEPSRSANEMRTDSKVIKSGSKVVQPIGSNLVQNKEQSRSANEIRTDSKVIKSGSKVVQPIGSNLVQNKEQSRSANEMRTDSKVIKSGSKVDTEPTEE